MFRPGPVQHFSQQAAKDHEEAPHKVRLMLHETEQHTDPVRHLYIYKNQASDRILQEDNRLHEMRTPYRILPQGMYS